MSEWIWGPDLPVIPDGLVSMVARRMYGVVVKDFAIVGHGHGKGIYLTEMSECCLENLWIHTTYDGAALFVDSTVMECEFINIHCYGNGSEVNREASLVVNTQEDGDSCNNLHFDKVYILHANYVGVEIGAGGKSQVPRLLFFNQCFFHGWLPLNHTAPHELILCDCCDLHRGVVLTDCRITNGGEDSPLIRLKQGCLRISGSTFGGGWGPVAILAEKGTRVTVAECVFHGASNGRQSLSATRADVTFVNNSIEAHEGVSQCVFLVDPNSAIIVGNRFYSPREQAIIIDWQETDETVRGPVETIGNVYDSK